MIEAHSQKDNKQVFLILLFVVFVCFSGSNYGDPPINFEGSIEIYAFSSSDSWCRPSGDSCAF